MLTKAAKKDIPSMIADDFAQEIFQVCIDEIKKKLHEFFQGCKTIFETREDDSMSTMWSGICSGQQLGETYRQGSQVEASTQTFDHLKCLFKGGG